MNHFKRSYLILACLCLATLIWSTQGIKCWFCDSPYMCKPPTVVKLEDYDTDWCCISESWRVPKDGGKLQLLALNKHGSNADDQKKLGMASLGCKRSTKQKDGAEIKIAKCCCDTDGCNKELNISALEGPDGFVDGSAGILRSIVGFVLLSSFFTLPRSISLILLGGIALYTQGSPANLSHPGGNEFSNNLSVFLAKPNSIPSLYAENDGTTAGPSREEGYVKLSELLRDFFPDKRPKGKIVHILSSAILNEKKRNKGVFTPMVQCPDDWFVTEVESLVEEDNTDPGGSGLNQIIVKCSSRTDEKKFDWLKTELWGKEKDDRPFTYEQGPIKCPGGSFAIGFGMKSDKDEKGGATAFGIYCSEEKNFRRELPGSRKGEWLGPKFMCPKKSAICGIRLQIEPTEKLSKTSFWGAVWKAIKSIFTQEENYRGAALTNVQMPCCELNPRCTPHDDWEVLVAYDNTGSADHFHSKFTKVSGSTTFEHDEQSGYSESEKNTETEHKVHSEVSGGIGPISAKVAYDFKNNVKTSEKTGFKCRRAYP